MIPFTPIPLFSEDAHNDDLPPPPILLTAYSIRYVLVDDPVCFGEFPLSGHTIPSVGTVLTFEGLLGQEDFCGVPRLQQAHQPQG